MSKFVKVGAGPKSPADVALEILKKYPSVIKGIPGSTEHEAAGDHFKELSRLLWEKEGPPTPRPEHREKKANAASKGEALKELLGLGAIGVAPADEIQAHIRARLAKDDSPDAAKKRQLLKPIAHTALDAGGLGLLGHGYIKTLLTKKASMHSCLDELEKLGESSNISAEDARRSLDRLDTLEKNKPTGKQVARNMAVGAGAGVGIGALGRAIAGAEPTGSKGRLHLAAAATGALGAGAIPLFQQHLARDDEKAQLRKFIEQEYRDHGPDTGATSTQKAAAAEVFDDLQALLANPEFLKTASTEEIAELAKVAINMASFQKLALPRYEQEIAAGNISRGDVTPGVPSLPGPFGAISRKTTREQLAAPAAVSPEALAKNRAMSDKLYEAQAMHPQTQGIGKDFTVRKEFLPGMGPATHSGNSTVYSPIESGQFMRGIDRPLGSLRSMAATVPAEKMDELGGLSGVAKSFAKLPSKQPVDSTLNHTILQHELGEASEVGKDTIRPAASHFGPEPILRENMAMRHDPEAQKIMAGIRQQHGDDALMQRAIRQAGGTPNAPLPLGGKAHRAVERIMDNNVSQLDPMTRLKAVQTQGLLDKHIGYMPKHVSETVGSLGEHAQALKGRLLGLQKEPSMGKLREALPEGRTFLGSLGSIHKFIKKGK